MGNTAEAEQANRRERGAGTCIPAPHTTYYLLLAASAQKLQSPTLQNASYGPLEPVSGRALYLLTTLPALGVLPVECLYSWDPAWRSGQWPAWCGRDPQSQRPDRFAYFDGSLLSNSRSPLCGRGPRRTHYEHLSGSARWWHGIPPPIEPIISQASGFCPTFGPRLAYAAGSACLASSGLVSDGSGHEPDLGEGC